MEKIIVIGCPGSGKSILSKINNKNIIIFKNREEAKKFSESVIKI